MQMNPTAAAIADHLSAGCRVALGDGVGSPVDLGEDLARAAREVGGVELFLGWCFDAPVDLDDAAAFPVIRSYMGGYALRDATADGRVSYVPARLGALPALLSTTLRPDVVILSARETQAGFAYSTESAWLPAAISSCTSVLVQLNDAAPLGSTADVIPAEAQVIGTTHRSPREVLSPTADPETLAIADRVAGLISAGCRIQIGPGRLGDAICAAINVPVHVDSGVIGDGVLDLERRGLLLGIPSTAYVVGSTGLYDWIDGRGCVFGVEHTHDITRLSQHDFLAINTTLEIDPVGQVNVEQWDGTPVSGVGGHGDFAMAASRSRNGLSIVALPLSRRGRSTLVERLSAPVSTGYSDVDIVVTAGGTADLRGESPAHRRELITRLWSR